MTSDENHPKTPQSLREEAILKFWDEAGIFEKTLKKDAPRGEFVFYDGPPYATGLPHFGHLLPSTIKDTIPRFKTMQGYHVQRKWGWDCHGLPIENLIEKKLGLADKKAIIDYGIDKFNRAARESVFEYDKEWQKVVHRLGRWIDMENAYHTMDPSYTESVWWSFKELHNKGLVYEGFRVMQICPRCETTLSNIEVGQGYKDVQDISVYVLFELENEPSTFFLAWTTTPWTLHGNAALAINPDIMYEKIKTTFTNDNIEIFIIIAKQALPNLQKLLPNSKFEVVEKFKGDKLIGTSYTPPFDTYFKEGSEFPIKDHESRRANAWKIYGAEFVTADSGTGIVHIAPAFGDDDYKLGSANNLPLLQHITFGGIARAELGETFAGKHVKDIENPQAYDIEVIKALAHSGKLFAKEKITHSYPHCWRCNTPLLNYATSAWFVEMTKLQSRAIEENNKVKWIPESVGTSRFGSWLENMRDWNISRSRFWGAPLPVWKGHETGKISVIGSIDELKKHIPKRNNFTVMRHGQSESNIHGFISSKVLGADGLTEVGREEIVAASEILLAKASEDNKNKITKIYASDFRRTRESAELIAELIGYPHKDIVYDERLRECLAGGFDGQSWAEHWSFFKNRNEKMFKRAPDGGESVFDVKTRSAEFMYEIDEQNENENILIITHGLPLRLVKGTAAGKTGRDLVRTGWSDVSDPNASLHEIDWRNLPHNESFELDIHRPYVDNIKWQDPETGEIMVRVPEVFDVWYDSGSMPYAQCHYPFENKEEFEKWKTAGDSSLFPADFIAEGLDQTRGWFYSLLSLGIGLFDRAPYKHVVVNGLILAEDGRKMSKSLNNYPPLMPTIEKYGADSMRFFLASSPATHGEEVSFSEKALDEVNKKVFNRLDNLYAFLNMYTQGELEEMNLSQIQDNLAKIKNPLDIWVLARLNQVISAVTKSFEAYQLDRAMRTLNEFIDDVSTWYVRRSRDRFKTEGSDRQHAIFTTRFVLENISRLMAPVTPFIAEDLYKKVRFVETAADSDSVHLQNWPLTIPLTPQNSDRKDLTPEGQKGFEDQVIAEMKAVQDLVEQGLALRSAAKIKVRQPLASFTYALESADSIVLSPDMEEILKDELNVKEVSRGEALTLDTEVTDELKGEGAVRDLMRAIQEERKNQDLNPKDLIDLIIAVQESGGESEVILRKHEDMLKSAVNANNISYVTPEFIAQLENDITVPFLEGSISFTFEISA